MQRGNKMDKSEKIGSYIDNFDAALGGGFPKGHIVLVYGSAGTMKSSICFNTLFNEILKGKKGAYISIEQSSLSLLRQMVGMGYDISKINIEVLNDANDVLKGLSKLKPGEEKKLSIIDFGSIRKQLRSTSQKKSKGMDFALSDHMVNTILEIAETLVNKDLCDIIIIDSLTAIYSLTELKDPRNEIFYLFEYLRDLGLTAFIISEESEGSTYSHFGVESYLVDGIIHLNLAERNRKVTREIQIVKMRSTDCNNDIYTLDFDGKKFKALYGGKMPLI